MLILTYIPKATFFDCKGIRVSDAAAFFESLLFRPFQYGKPCMKYIYCDTFYIFSPFFLVFTDRERPYLIVKAVIRLSDPAAMDLVLRKRICFNVYKRHSITDKIRRRMGHTSSLTSLGVVYEIVSNIPKVSSDTKHYNIGTWLQKLF